MKIQEFNYDMNLKQCLLWQYNDAIGLQSLAQEKEDWYTENYTQFWTDWYNNVFNLLTANRFGLSVWAIILDLPIFEGKSDNGKPIFGFGANNQNFGNGNFSYNSPYYNLDDEEIRLLLRLRYFQTLDNCSLNQTNYYLSLAFETFGQVYILDGLDMSITCVFKFDIPKRLLRIIKQFDLIPRANGVDIKYVVDPAYIFGFGRFNKNFNHGNFLPEE
jgi:hypothetical protein